MKLDFGQIGETVHARTLPNGLQVSYLEKQGFSKDFAILAVNFGSCDSHFSFEGRDYRLPAGVAHFLEHKMFECEDGNALQKLTALGASPNAFTSRTMTAYHFSCTERFQECLELLLGFVFTPWFTEENVAKERGIIAQEIAMLDDSPSWRAYGGLYEGLYHEHPIRESIAGSRESIAQITPALLSDCHRAFYTPGNMALVVCGSASFDALCETAGRLSPAPSRTGPVRDYGSRADGVCQPTVTHRMQASQPQAFLGFRDAPLAPGESRLRRRLLGDLCCRLVSGPASPLYARLFAERLITQNFDTEYSTFPEGAAAVFGGLTRDPAALRAALEEAVRTSAQGLPAGAFGRAKRALYGASLRAFDDPSAYARHELAALFHGEHYASFPALLEGLAPEDVYEMLGRWVSSSQSAVLPLDAPPEGGLL